MLPAWHLWNIVVIKWLILIIYLSADGGSVPSVLGCWWAAWISVVVSPRSSIYSTGRWCRVFCDTCLLRRLSSTYVCGKMLAVSLLDMRRGFCFVALNAEVFLFEWALLRGENTDAAYFSCSEKTAVWVFSKWWHRRPVCLGCSRTFVAATVNNPQCLILYSDFFLKRFMWTFCHYAQEITLNVKNQQKCV